MTVSSSGSSAAGPNSPSSSAAGSVSPTSAGSPFADTLGDTLVPGADPSGGTGVATLPDGTGPVINPADPTRSPMLSVPDGMGSADAASPGTATAPVSPTPPPPAPAPRPGKGSPEVRQLLDEIDWSATSLGPRGSWSVVVQLMVNLCLDSEFPLQLALGPDLVLVYNDAYIPLLGAEKHPWALGRTVREVWPETWQENERWAHEVMATGRAYHNADQQVILDRHGYPEEAYLTFSESVIRDLDGSVVGLFTVASETTAHILYERRLRVLRGLAAVSVTAYDSLEATCRAALEVMARARESVPFASMYLRAADGRVRRVASYGFDEAASDGCELAAEEPTDGPVLEVLRTGRSVEVSDIDKRCPGLFKRGPIGPAALDHAFVRPLILGANPEPAGVLVIGANPYRPQGDEYPQFTGLVARQMSIVLGDAAAYQMERDRQRKLTELDRDKTAFFQNLTHELRTPLTTLLAPLNEVLDDGVTVLPVAARESLEMSRRAAGRLRKMIGALLQYSLAEFGTLTAKRQPTNLTSVTADLVAGFRLAAEQAGVRLRADLPDDGLVAQVDRGMWASIVNNLVGNAVKYTGEGDIVVGLRGEDGNVVLRVSDTGPGIPLEQQPRIFDRFHRVDGSDRSTGAGIGLALVADAVRAHDGTVEVSSEPGHGSTFTVRLPQQGESQEAAGEEAGAPADLDEELAELLDEPASAGAGQLEAVDGTEAESAQRVRLLVVEDEPDLRGYITGLLAREGYDVTAAPDAETALAALQAEDEGRLDPQLVLVDVMLPGKSGLELLGWLRQHEQTARVPVIVLTGMSGSETAVEALLAGADDYVVKPFDAAELVARVRAHRHAQELREVAVDRAETVAGQLRQALASNRMIGTAIGIVMTRYGLAADRAFHTLVRISQQSNRKLREVAEEIVAAGTIPPHRG